VRGQELAVDSRVVMSEQTSYRCDICNIEKQQSNHWLKGYLLYAESAVSSGIIIVPWLSDDVAMTDEGQVRLRLLKPGAHLCGEAHAIKWASKNLAKGKYEH